jgi:hypothetical protein
MLFIMRMRLCVLEVAINPHSTSYSISYPWDVFNRTRSVAYAATTVSTIDLLYVFGEVCCPYFLRRLKRRGDETARYYTAELQVAVLNSVNVTE